MGVLQAPTTKENWRQKSTQLSLFAHNTQQSEISSIDVFDTEAGRGICGRILDVLKLNGYKPGGISVNGIAGSLRSNTSPQLVVDSSGYQKFNPVSVLAKTTSVTEMVRDVNLASSIRSSLFGNTWSNTLFSALDENELMFDEISKTSVTANFPDTDLGRQLKSVAKLIQTKDVRGTDRDIFNVRMDNFE